MKSLENNGIILLNRDKIKQYNKEKTIIVLGLPRSGTSMIGKALYALEVFHDDGFLNKNVYEDKKAIKIFEETPEMVEQYIKEQNNKYNIWGFKRPGAFYYINKYIDKIRNPIFIIPFKDILSISLRKNISIDMDFNDSLRETIKQMNELMQYIYQNKTPTILFSYEKAILNPDNFVQEIVKLLVLENITTEQISTAINSISINPKEYLESSRIKINGRVDNLKDGILSGWTKADIDDRVVEINVYDLHYNLISCGKASMFRQDLKDNNIGNGYHAFQVEIDKTLTIKDIIVTAGKHKDKLQISQNLK